MVKTHPAFWRVILSSIFIFLSVGCESKKQPVPFVTNVPTPAAATTLQPTMVIPSSTYTLSPSAPPVVATSTIPVPGRFIFSNPRAVVIASNLSSPDDLAAGPGGAIYISNTSTGSIDKLAPDGSVQTVVTGLKAPEGMIYLPGDVLVIAEQGENHLLKLALNTGKLTVLLTLGNTTHKEGIDGIAIDTTTPGAESIIIPDSPNGALRRISI